MAMPIIQEEATVMLADEIEGVLTPKGLAVIVKATHLCMTWRGVQENDAMMTTSVMRGSFREQAALRAEFTALINL
jgi:GTP cyclohydrolase I